MSSKCSSNADKLLYTTLLHQYCHIGIELLFGLSTLVNVAQDECTLASFLVGTAVHKVECNVERVYIGIVRVVDERTTVLPLLHFKAHSDRFEHCHALRQHIGLDTKVQGYHCTGYAVADACIVDKGQSVASLRSLLPYIVDGRCCFVLLNAVYIEGGSGVVFRPRQQLPIVMGCCYALRCYLVVELIDQGLRAFEQQQLLVALLFQRRKVFLMGSSKTRQYAHRRQNDIV